MQRNEDSEIEIKEVDIEKYRKKIRNKKIDRQIKGQNNLRWWERKDY